MNVDQTMVNSGRFDHRGIASPVGMSINQIDYTWIKDREKHKEKLKLYREFEQILSNDYAARFVSTSCHELWKPIQSLYQDMVSKMQSKGSTNIIDGMKDPFHVRWWRGKCLPLKGNRRLCILRSQGYEGDVPCVFIDDERDSRMERGRPYRKRNNQQYGGG